MELTACTSNLKLYLPDIAGQLCKQTIFKILGNEHFIFHVLVFSVYFFCFHFSKKIPICLTLNSFVVRKKKDKHMVSLKLPLWQRKCVSYGKEVFYFRFTNFCWNIFSKNNAFTPRNIRKGTFYETWQRKS